MAPSPRATVLQLAAALDAGKTTSRALVDEALARIADPAGEGKRTFIKVYAETARQAADAQDRLRRGRLYRLAARRLAGVDQGSVRCRRRAHAGRLEGARRRGRRRRATRAIVARLRAAGAVIIGRTNMTEFAFSGVGINPHYGTPGNPYDRKRIPGGSSSGAAVSVGGRAMRRRDRNRYRRLGAHPVGALRPRRLQADAETRAARWRVPAVDDARFDRASCQQRRLLRDHRCDHGGRGAGRAGRRWGPPGCDSAFRAARISSMSSMPKSPPASSALAPCSRAPAPGSPISRCQSLRNMRRSTPRAVSRRPRRSIFTANCWRGAATITISV